MKNNIETLLTFVSMRLRVPALIVNNDFTNLQNFEGQYCRYTNLQTEFTKEYIMNVINTSSHDTIYRIEDIFKLNLFLFNVQGIWCIIGPFSEGVWEDSQIEVMLLSASLPMSYFQHIKSYRLSFSSVSVRDCLTYVYQIIECIENKHTHPDYSYLSDAYNCVIPELPSISKFNTTIIHDRYERENALINAVKNGDKKAALEAYINMPVPSEYKNLYEINEKVQLSNFSIIKTLVRKAAENAGLDIFQVHIISQTYAHKVKKMNKSTNVSKMTQMMISDFCDAIDIFKNSKYSPTINLAIIFIKNSYSQNIKLSDVADEVNVSKCHLSRLFKKETNLTVTQYIALQRLKKAAELLKNSHLPIQNISTYVGYSDNNYFSKVFFKYYNLSPSDFRKIQTT